MGEQNRQDAPEGDRPRRAPDTDPTNPYHQESAGVWVRAEEAAERHNDEPGLTDRVREERAILGPPQG